MTSVPRRTTLTTLLAAGLVAAFSGCTMHTPEGGFLPFSGGSHTYYSTETSPKTVTIVDVRTEEELFRIDIPVGKQLSFRFLEGDGDDSVYTPDLMQYEIWPIGTDRGSLTNSLTVPNAQCRRIDVDLRYGIEYAEAPPEAYLRTDQQANRPAWWTPQGGPMPASRDHTAMYDR